MRQSRHCGTNNTDTQAQDTKSRYLFDYRETNRNSTAAINMTVEPVYGNTSRSPWALDTVSSSTFQEFRDKLSPLLNRTLFFVRRHTARLVQKSSEHARASPYNVPSSRARIRVTFV